MKSNYWRQYSVDRDVPLFGKAKTNRVLLGMELMLIRRAPGSTFTPSEIALWCGCTNQAIKYIERQALRKVRRMLRQERI